MKWTGKHWALALTASVAIHSIATLAFVDKKETVEIERASGAPIAVSAVSVAQAFQAQEHVIEPTSDAKAVENIKPDSLLPALDHNKPAPRVPISDPVKPAGSAKALRPLQTDLPRSAKPRAQTVKTQTPESAPSLQVSQTAKRGAIQIATATRPEHLRASSIPLKTGETARKTTRAVKPTAAAKPAAATSPEYLRASSTPVKAAETVRKVTKVAKLAAAAKQHKSEPAQVVKSRTTKQAVKAVVEPQTVQQRSAELQAITPVTDLQEPLLEPANAAAPSPKPRRARSKPTPQQTKKQKVQKQKSRATNKSKPKTVVARLQKQSKKPDKQASKRSKRSSQGRTGSKTKGRAAKRAGDGGQKQRATGKANLSNYLGKVISRLHRQKRYPKSARRKKIQGTAVVAFVINANGSIGNLRIRRSAGHAMLDQAVLSMVRRAAPFPPIPAKSGKKRMPISVPVKFAVR